MRDPDFQFNPGSSRQVGKIFWQYYDVDPIDLTETGFSTLVARYKRLLQTQENLEWDDVVRKAIDNREWDVFSTQADVLHEYERQGIDFASIALGYREADKLHGTYVLPIAEKLDPNGFIHGGFWIGGTTTGRISASGPNLQNLAPFAKDAYVSRFGASGLILSADYSQIELRVAACLYSDPEMIAAYRRGADLHTLTALVVSGLSEAQYQTLPKDKQKWWRTLAKRINFGIVYSIGAVGLVNTLRKEGVFITIEEARALIDKFFAEHPALLAAINALKQFVRENGYLQTFTGRYRRLPEAFSSNEEIVARACGKPGTPVQSGAGDIALMALVLINRRMKAQKMKSVVIATVHDSIVADCHVDEVFGVAVIMRDVMENLPRYSEEVLPGLDWSWLVVPLVVEFEVGVSWGHAVEFDIDDVLNGAGSSDPLWWEDNGALKYRKPSSVDELWELIERKAARL